MIHEIHPHSFNNQFLILNAIGADDHILHYNGNTLLLKTTPNGYEIPRKSDLPGIPDAVKKHYLFSFNQVPCFLVFDLPETTDSHLIYKEISIFRTLNQKEITWISQVGSQLMNWYTQNKYCGK